MPELPEVEQFRTVLLPLVSDTHPLEVALVSDSPPRSWVSEDEVASLHEKVVCTDVLRKGKLLCLVLKKKDAKKTKEDAMKDEEKKNPAAATALQYLFLHMGMTGAVQSPGVPMYLGSDSHNESALPSPMEKQKKTAKKKQKKGAKKEAKEDDEEEEVEEQKEEVAESFPPPYTHLTLKVGDYRVAFTDPRKFGKCELSQDLSDMDELAPDGLLGIANETDKASVLPNVMNQPMGIKALLLDQKRAVSGAGNWVADEVLYQIEMHPDQTYLTEAQAKSLLEKLHEVMETGVDSLKQGCPYPSSWLFHYRWTKKKGGAKDSKGQELTFLKSGGRTSAIVESVQKLKKQKKLDTGDNNKKSNSKMKKTPPKTKSGEVGETNSTSKRKRPPNSSSSTTKKEANNDGSETKTDEPKTAKRRSTRLATTS